MALSPTHPSLSVPSSSVTHSSVVVGGIVMNIGRGGDGPRRAEGCYPLTEQSQAGMRSGARRITHSPPSHPRAGMHTLRPRNGRRWNPSRVLLWGLISCVPGHNPCRDFLTEVNNIKPFHGFWGIISRTCQCRMCKANQFTDHESVKQFS